jgi:hypothetical protein
MKSKSAYFPGKILMIAVAGLMAIILSGCPEGTEKSEAKINFQFKFDPSQARLNNLGLPAQMPAGHAAQSPDFNSISAHYVELSQEATTPLGKGIVLYKNAETTQGGSNAIDFSKSVISQQGEIFLTLPVSSIPVGTYKYLRVSLAYQNYNINVLANGFDIAGTIASFVGYNTFITNHTVKSQIVSVNANKKQGYWAFESAFGVTEGQAPEGATTVPNPLASTSPIPTGSCVVTGAFANPVVITGKETADINIIISLSINNSFEWIEVNADGKFEPLAGETVVDMGLRGLIPIVQ